MSEGAPTIKVNANVHNSPPAGEEEEGPATPSFDFKTDVIFNGYLKKPGNYIHNWKVRYYILTPNYLHRFQPSQSGKLYGREVGKVKIKDIAFIKPIFNHKGKDHCFEIVLKDPGSRVVPRILRASTKDEAQKWIDLIEKQIKSDGGASTPSSSSPVKAAAGKAYQPDILEVSILEGERNKVLITKGAWGKVHDLKKVKSDTKIKIKLSKKGEVNTSPPLTSQTTSCDVTNMEGDVKSSKLKIKWEVKQSLSNKEKAIKGAPVILALLCIAAMGLGGLSSELQIGAGVAFVVFAAVGAFGLLKKPSFKCSVTFLEWLPSVDAVVEKKRNSAIQKDAGDDLSEAGSEVGVGPAVPHEMTEKELEAMKEKYLKAPDYVRFKFAEPTEEECLKRWIATHKWRKDENIDTILKRPHQHYDLIRKHYPAHIVGKSKSGAVFYCERPGLIDLNALYKEGLSVDDVLYHYMFLTEYLWTESFPLETDKSFYFLDLTGVGMSTAMGGDTMAFLKKSSKIMGAHYPERSYKTMIINAPFWFTTFWNVLKTFLNKKTIDKVIILGSNYQSTLFEHVDKEVVPPIWGGTGPNLGESPSELKMDELVHKLNASLLNK